MSKNMYIYEPALCCETGLCGVSIDTELLRISTVFGSLEKNGIQAVRYNLNNNPNEFVKNEKINQLLAAESVEILPVTVVDGTIVKKGKYPTNDEIEKWLEVSRSYLGGALKTTQKFTNTKKSGGCGCAGGGY